MLAERFFVGTRSGRELKAALHANFLLRVRGAEKPGRNWRRHFNEKTFRACEEGFLREHVVSSALSGKTLVAGVNYLKKYM